MRKPSEPASTVRPERLLTPQQVAERLQLSLRTVRRLIADGKLRVFRLGRAVRIAEADLEQFLDQARL